MDVLFESGRSARKDEMCPGIYGMYYREAMGTIYKVFGMTWPGIPPTILRFLGGRANHMGTDQAILFLISK